MEKRAFTKREFLSRALVFFIWSAVVLFLFSRHENWRDEAQSWLMARDLDILQLFCQMKYEGHPCLWHLILMPFAKLGFPYRTMNLISITLTAIAAVLMLWKSPIPLSWQIPVLFGSAFLYYMPVVSRSYSLIPVLLFLSAVFYEKRHQHPVAYGTALALLVQTHLYIIPFAGILALIWFFEALAVYRKSRNSHFLIRQAVGLTLPLISFLLFLAQMRGVGASSAYTLSKMQPGLRHYLQLLDMRLLVFMPSEAPAFLLAHPVRSFFLIMFFFLVPGVVLFLYACKKRDDEVLKATAAYEAGVAAQIVLTLLAGRGSAQKSSILAFLSIWFLWVLWPRLHKNKTMRRLALSSYAGIAVLFLLMNKAALYDIHNYYSGSPKCAAFIQENLPEDAMIFQNNTSAASAVIAYLDADSYFSLESGKPESYATWVSQKPAITSYEAFCSTVEQLRPGTDKAYLLLDLDEMGPYADILAHTGDDFLYSSFLEEPLPPFDTYVIYEIPVDRQIP